MTGSNVVDDNKQPKIRQLSSISDHKSANYCLFLCFLQQRTRATIAGIAERQFGKRIAAVPTNIARMTTSHAMTPAPVVDTNYMITVSSTS